MNTVRAAQVRVVPPTTDDAVLEIAFLVNEVAA